MTIDAAEMRVRITGDSSGADKVLDSAGKKVGGFQQKVGGLGKTLTGTAALSAVGFVGITGPILGAGLAMVNSASDQGEALNKVNVVYGDSKNTILDWASNSSTALGMTQTQAMDTAGTFGNIYTSMGFTQDQAAGMSTQFIGLATDLGSFNNVPTPEALQAIQSGLVGEYEPLKRFGILLNEDKVKMKALEMGLGDANGELTEQEKVLARQELIWEQSSNAHGDFVETSDGLANSTKIVRAMLGDLSAELGAVLLPAVVAIVAGLVGFLEKLDNISPKVKTFVVVLGLIAAAAGPVLLVVSMMIPAFGLLGTILGVLLGPVGLVIGALVLLGAAYKSNFLGFGDAVRAVGSKIKDGIDVIVKKFREVKVQFDALRQMTDPVSAALKALTRVFPGLTGAIAPLLSGVAKIKDGFNAAKQFVTDLMDSFNRFRHSGLDPVSAAVRALGEVWSPFREHVTSVLVAVDKLKDGFKNVKDAISDFLNGNFSEGLEKLKEGFSSIFDGLGDIGGVIKDLLGNVDWSGIWNGIKDAAKDAFDGLKEDVTEVVDGILAAFRGIDWGALWSGVKNIASSIVSGLGDLAGALWTWISNAASSVDWTALLNNAKDIVTGLSGKLGDLTKWALKWISDAASAVDWTGLLANAKDIVTGLSGKLGDLIAWASKWVQDAGNAINWTAILSKATDIVTGLSGRLGDLLKWAVKWVTDAGNAIDWKLILSKANNITNGLSGKLGDLIAWVKKWISDATPSFETWKGIIGNVGDVTAAIVDGLGDLGQALLDWVTGAWDSAMAWLDEKKNGFSIFGWKPLGGGGESGGESGGEQTVTQPPPGMPTTTKWDASAMAGSINAAMVSAMALLSGESLAGALENWIWRAAAIVGGGAILDDMIVIARAMDVGLLAAFAGFSGASLASTINNWIMLAAGQMGSLLPGPMKVIASAMDTAFVAAFAGFSGASAAGAISGWLTKAITMAAAQLTALDAIKTRFTTFVGETTTALSTWAEALKTTVTDATTVAGTAIGTFGTNATTVIRTFTSTATGQVNTWAGNFRSVVTGAMGDARNAVATGGSQMESSIRTAASNMTSAMRTGMEALKSAVRNAVNDIPGIISGVGGSAVSTARSIGVNISNAFAQGMESMLGRIRAAANAMVSAADIALRKKAELKSPSRLFRRHGAHTGEGYQLGILDLIPDVARAGESLVNAAIPSMATFGFGSATPVVEYRTAPITVPSMNTQNGGGNTYIIMTRSELLDLFDTVDTVKVMTDSAEFSATFGG